MATIPSNFNFPTKNQVPEHAILDYYNKQAYLGNQFAYAYTGISLGSTSETNLTLLQNPSTSTKSLFCIMRSVSSSAQAVQFRFYFNPTFSAAGTAHTPINLRIASGNVSVATLTSAPTSSADGILVESIECPTGYAQQSSSMILILDPGQSLLATATALSNTTVVNLNQSWFEL